MEIFIQRAELMSPNGAGEEWRKSQTEQIKLIKHDQSTTGLFSGFFDKKKPAAIIDAEDNTMRCGLCSWEVHNGRCQNPSCGTRYRRSAAGIFADSDSDSDFDDSDDGSDVDMDPERWPESIIGETTTHEIDSEEDDDEWEDEDNDGFDMDGHHHGEENEEEDEGGPVTSRRRLRAPVFHLDTDDAESETESEGSLADFVDHDTPHGNRHNRSDPPWSLPPPTSSQEPIRPVRRRNARRVILDEDDEDTEGEQSSVSEASSAAPARGFRGNAAPQNHAGTSSDYDEEQSHLLANGYESLTGMTTDEDEGPMNYMGGRRALSGSLMNSPGVLTVLEESEEDDEFADDSEDTDGDTRMSDNSSRNNRQSVNRQLGGSRIQPIDLDSASESEVALSTRRRTRRQRPSQVPRPGDYLGNQRATNGTSRISQRDRLSALIDPALQDLYSMHTQQLTEQQYNSLGARTSSVSPARSLTPVQRGNRSRTGTPLSSSSIPPPFSPLQQTHPIPGAQRTPTVSSTNSSRQQTPNANPSPNIGRGLSSPPAPSLYPSSQSTRSSTLSPRATTNNPPWSPPSHLVGGQVQRTASPAIRVRSRASRPALRTTSRTGLRSNSTNMVSPSLTSFAPGTAISTSVRPFRTHDEIYQRGLAARQQQMAREQNARQNGRQTPQRNNSGGAPAMPRNIIDLVSSPAGSDLSNAQGVAWVGGSGNGRGGGPGIRFNTGNGNGNGNSGA